MKLRSLLLAILLLALLVPTAWADGNRKGEKRDQDRERQTEEVFYLRLASGRAAPGQADPRVTVVLPNGSSQTAVVCEKRPEAWASRMDGSRWISPQADCTANFEASPNYQYRTSFELPANFDRARIVGKVLVDDTVTIRLNDHVLFTGGGFREKTHFRNEDSTLFRPGVNTLTFTVNNVVGPTGLDFKVRIRAFDDTANHVKDKKDNDKVKADKKDNHGRCVSTVAQLVSSGPEHGKAVSKAARITCRDDD